MSKLLVFIKARMSSSRCPNKVAYDLGGKPTFVQILERVQQFVPDANYYFVNTTVETIDDPLVLLAKAYGYDVFRHAVDSTVRGFALFDHLGLKPDDMYIGLSGDEPFMICDYLPFARKIAKETGLSAIALRREHSIAWAMGGTGCMFVEYAQQEVRERWRNTWKLGSAAFVLFSARSAPPIQLPEKYQQPWPWNPLFLDYPLQALQIKAIYQALYRGSPIDIFDLPELFERNPALAHLVEPNIPLTTNIKQPYEDIPIDLETIEWDGKEGLCDLGSDKEATPDKP